MKILFLTDNFPPEVNAPATRTFEHCKEWVAAGADVTVITGFPNFPQGKVYEGYRNRLRQVETIEGIKVIRVWSYITANQGFLRRTLDYLSFAFSSFLFGLFQKADVIIATSPQFFTTWTAYLLSKLKRKPWIFELRDLWPESIATVGAMDKGRVYRLLESIELGLYHNADMVVPNTPAFKENLVKRGIDAGKIHVVTNGASLELFAPREKDRQLLKELKLEGKFTFGYIGTHGMAHSLDFIIRSLEKIEQPDIHFLFIGDGAMKKKIVKMARQRELKNVTFLDPVAKVEVPRYLSIVDASLVPLKESDTFKTVIPSKIFESCAMKKPILLGVDGQARELIEEYKAGLYFEPENETDFVDAVYRMVNDQSLYLELAENSLLLAKAYDRRDLAMNMLGVIQDYLQQRSLQKTG